MYEDLIGQILNLSSKYDTSLINDIISKIDAIFNSLDKSQIYQRQLILKVRNAIKQHDEKRFTEHQILVLGHAICQVADDTITHIDILTAENFMMNCDLSPFPIIDF